jgi:hypothetical protein
MDTGVLFQEKSRQGMNLTTHHHMVPWSGMNGTVPWSGMNGTVPLLLLYVFKARTVTNLFYLYFKLAVSYVYFSTASFSANDNLTSDSIS